VAVDVRFRNRRLARCYEDPSEAIRRWGPAVGERYVKVVDLLHEAPNAPALFAVRALDLHPLTGDLRGYHALRLSGRFRLIVELRGDVMTIEDVVDYHG
jgi:plasmid maintenance system killer protein